MTDERSAIAFLALLQVGRDDDFSDVGLRQVVAGCKPGDDPLQVGIDWALEMDPQGEQWRVLVWSGTDGEFYDGEQPSVVVTPAHLAERSTPTAGGNRRSAVPRPRPRVRVPGGQVVLKTRAYDEAAGCDVLGKHILITQDRRNTTADACPGPWWPANEPTGDAVAAYVRGIGLTRFRDRGTLSIETTAGWMRMLPPTLAVVVAEQD